MKISDFLSSKTISVDLQSQKKEDLVNEMLELLVAAKKIKEADRQSILEALMAREALGSTAIGQGIAIPHAKSDSVDKLVGCVGISKAGMDFESLDGENVHIFFLLVAPIDSAGPHLKALARISRLLKDKFIRESLKNVPNPEDILNIIQQEDERLSQQV